MVRTSRAVNQDARRRKTRHGGVFEVPINRIKPSPENDVVYKAIDPNNPENVALAASVKKFGVKEHIVVDRDGYIISGHRRYWAACNAGLKTVPVRYESISRAEDPDGFIVALREYNRQRTKTFDEIVREEVIDVSAQEAQFQLYEYRQAKAAVALDGVDLGDTRVRSQISNAKLPMVEAIKAVVMDNRQFWPLSVRQVHYLLLAVSPLRHASKPGSTYKNDRASYSDLTDVCLRARLEGFVPVDAIDDQTRPVTHFAGYAHPRAFITASLDDLLQGYYRSLMQSQPLHLELVGEKNTLAGILRPIASEFTIPMTLGRGYCSFPPLRDIARRYEQSGKQQLVLVVVSDHDPEGNSIPEALGHTLRDDLHVRNVRVVKAALTPEQVKRFALPPSADVKDGARRDGYVERFQTTKVWELESLKPTDLQAVVREAIEALIDREALNREIAAEAEDARQICQLRAKIMKVISANSEVVTAHGGAV